MHDVRQRLAKCFSAVFPELSPEDFGKANDRPAVDWDSLSAVTVLAVVQEEFGIDLELEDMESASFPEILERVREAIQNKSPLDSSVVH
jgi:acyl carrier protein